MKFLSKYIYIYMILGISFLLPVAGSIQFDSNTFIASKFIKHASKDFDENHLVTPISDLRLESTANLRSNLIPTTDIEVENTKTESFVFNAKEEQGDFFTQKKPGYWKTLHSIESKQGKLLYRPRNKKRNCNSTSSPCGHHQLSVQALKDISCKTKQCKMDRENFSKSLAMSKKLQKINEKRLLKAGYKNLPEYQKYLIHQQGANGLKTILASSKGTKLLSRNIKRNMAGNSPYSYRSLRRMGSKLAAKKFLRHWKNKWKNEKKLIVSNNPKQVNTLTDDENSLAIVESNKSIKKEVIIAEDPTIIVPLFNDFQLQVALNIKL